jgi:hypothetical protein
LRRQIVLPYPRRGDLEDHYSKCRHTPVPAQQAEDGEQHQAVQKLERERSPTSDCEDVYATLLRDPGERRKQRGPFLVDVVGVAHATVRGQRARDADVLVDPGVLRRAREQWHGRVDDDDERDYVEREYPLARADPRDLERKTADEQCDADEEPGADRCEKAV